MNYRVVNEFKEPTSEERTMGMLIYLLSFFTIFIGPLIIWLLKKTSLNLLIIMEKNILILLFHIPFTD